MVWLTNYKVFGARTNGVMNNNDTITNPLNGQVLLAQWGKVDLSPVLWRIVLRRSSRVRVEQCDFHIKVTSDKSPISESPKVEIQQRLSYV